MFRVGVLDYYIDANIEVYQEIKKKSTEINLKNFLFNANTLFLNFTFKVHHQEMGTNQFVFLNILRNRTCFVCVQGSYGREKYTP